MSSWLHTNFLKYQAKIVPSTPKKVMCLLLKCTGLHWGIGTLERTVETTHVFKGKTTAVLRYQTDGRQVLVWEVRNRKMGSRKHSKLDISVDFKEPSCVRSQDRFSNQGGWLQRTGTVSTQEARPEGLVKAKGECPGAECWALDLKPGSVSCSPRARTVSTHFNATKMFLTKVLPKSTSCYTSWPTFPLTAKILGFPHLVNQCCYQTIPHTVCPPPPLFNVLKETLWAIFWNLGNIP